MRKYSHSFLSKEENLCKENKKILIERILEERDKAAYKIQKHVKVFITRVTTRKKIFFQVLFEARTQACIKLQRKIKSFLVYQHIHSMRKKYDLVFFYNFTHTSMKGVYNLNERNVLKLLLWTNSGKNSTPTELAFNYSRPLRTFYLPFSKQRVIKKRFRVNFMVNDNIIIDPRYEVDSDENGRYFNIVESTMLYRNNKSKCPRKKSPPIDKDKYWENIFQIKIKKHSKDSESISDKTDLSVELMNNIIPIASIQSNLRRTINVKSILKKRSLLQEESTPKRKDSSKKVTFCESVEFSF